MREALRPLLLLWFVYHLFVMAVDISKHISRMVPETMAVHAPLAAIADLRRWTEFYQWRVGVHQNWTMFVPNPRLSTSWLEVEGSRRRDGERMPLPLVIGKPDQDGIIWTYARAGKHERNAVASHREKLRMAYTRYYCRRYADTPDALQSVHFYVVTQPTPRPEDRASAGPRETWRTSRRKVGGWNCGR